LAKRGKGRFLKRGATIIFTRNARLSNPNHFKIMLSLLKDAIKDNLFCFPFLVKGSGCVCIFSLSLNIMLELSLKAFNKSLKIDIPCGKTSA